MHATGSGVGARRSVLHATLRRGGVAIRHACFTRRALCFESLHESMGVFDLHVAAGRRRGSATSPLGWRWGRSERSQPFRLTRPASTRKSNAPSGPCIVSWDVAIEGLGLVQRRNAWRIQCETRLNDVHTQTTPLPGKTGLIFSSSNV